jgi:hypothetical protein
MRSTATGPEKKMLSTFRSLARTPFIRSMGHWNHVEMGPKDPILGLNEV